MTQKKEKAFKALTMITRQNSDHVQERLTRDGRKANAAFVESVAKYYPALKKLAEK